MACATLEKRSQKLGQPISMFSPSLLETLKNIVVAEINKDTKKTMNKLIKAKK